MDDTKLRDAFGKTSYPILGPADSMDQAVITARRLAKKGDIVLLSPACASFDLFDNYEDRGRQFKQAVRDL